VDTERISSKKVWKLGIVDVGPVILSHCDNPAKDEAIDFMTQVLTGKIDAIIPLSTFIHAYHIMTRYLGVRKYPAAKEIQRTLRLFSPKFIEDLPLEVCLFAMDIASRFNLGGWDSYLVALSHTIGAAKIYTLNQELAKVDTLKVVSPISEDTLATFHDWFKKKM